MEKLFKRTTNSSPALAWLSRTISLLLNTTGQVFDCRRRGVESVEEAKILGPSSSQASEVVGSASDALRLRSCVDQPGVKRVVAH